VKRTLLLAALAAVVVAIILVLTLAGPAGDSGAKRLTLLLDFFPNADHAGIYAAQADGRFRAQKLDVGIHAPSDPSVPLKLLAAGKADLAISYEPEVLRARDKGLPVVAVAALVRVPLTAIVSLPQAAIHTPADLRGKRVATAGIDYQSAYLDAILRRAGVARSSVRELNVGFDLVPALLAGRADAVLGAYWNYEAIQLRQEGRRPNVIRIERAGVPTYDELVVTATESTVAHRPALVRSFLRALAAGTRDLAARSPRAVDALVKANPDLDRRLQSASIAVTLPYFLPPAGGPYGYLDPAAWRAFTAFMQRNGILSARVRAESAFTDTLLP
jgi:putative hydroxymethylpyrimidine transport system substrate-binding protein